MGISTVVCGRHGRMATLLAEAVRSSTDLTLTAVLSLRGARVPGGQAGDAVPVVGALAEVGGPPPVLVDFTDREATGALLRQAAELPCSLVIGTSGLTATELSLLGALSRERAVLRAANFSLSLAVVRRFVRDLAHNTGPDWAAGVLDVHFAGKRDAPSATAVMLAGEWGAERERPALASFRVGGGVSEHRVLASGPNEEVEVSHRVADRAAFAPGVLAAVRFVESAPPGLYALEDILEDAPCG